MGSYPTSPRSDFLAWCQAHLGTFESNAAAIGLTPAQALAFKNAVNTAAEREGQAVELREAAKAATSSANDGFGTLRRVTGDTVRSIKTFAETTNNPNVYTIAQIPPPAAPSPVPAPGQPRDVVVELSTSTGELTLKWKCDNPRGASGTSYIVRRKTPAQTTFEFIGVTGLKKFTDTTLISGPDSVQYTIQAQRSDLAGPVSSIITVNFGRAGDGMIVGLNSGSKGRRIESFTTTDGSVAARAA